METLTITQLSKQFAAKERSPVEYAQQTIRRLREDAFNAIVAFNEAEVLAAAKASEQRYCTGKQRSPVDGVPIGIKDIVDTSGLRTSYGCDVYLSHVPLADAYIVRQLKAAGAITAIKTNTSQFALGPTGEYCLRGAVRNPHDFSRYAGGSSSGSAAAVAAGIVPASIGTDSGGSIRIPSSLCGIVGMKPTYALISNAGILPISDATDTVGPMTNSIADSALLLQILAAQNSRDWRQSRPPAVRYAGRIGESIRGVKIAALKDFFHGCIDPEISAGCARAVTALRQIGGAVAEQALPDLCGLREAQQLCMLAFARSVHAADIEKHSASIYPQVLARLHKGDISASLYIESERKKTKLLAILFEALRDVECLVYPTTPLPAQKIGDGEKPLLLNGVETTAYASTGATAWIGSFSGLPCLDIPVGKTRAGLPYGLSLLGHLHSEANLYRIGEALLQAL